MRMNQAAESVLVAIGRPALQPLLDTLAGKNEEANKLVELSIESFRRKDAQLAGTMNKQNLVAHEAVSALGRLGLCEALDPIIKETDTATRPPCNAAIACESDLPEARRPRSRGARRSTRRRTSIRPRCSSDGPIYSPEVIPHLLSVATTTDEEFPPADLRLRHSRFGHKPGLRMSSGAR